MAEAFVFRGSFDKAGEVSDFDLEIVNEVDIANIGSKSCEGVGSDLGEGSGCACQEGALSSVRETN